MVAALFNPALTEFVATWFIPMEQLPVVGKNTREKWVIQPSKAADSADRYALYRCLTSQELAQKIVAVCDAKGRS